MFNLIEILEIEPLILIKFTYLFIWSMSAAKNKNLFIGKMSAAMSNKIKLIFFENDKN